MIVDAFKQSNNINFRGSQCVKA